jgi:NhaA family Na+:H+ antiporter
MLIVAAAIALLWANSPFAQSYVDLWHTPIGLHVGSFGFERELHFWINDGLMTIFFFVVGLEIRKEIHSGELSTLKRAALPLVAALGGMLAPALIFISLNAGLPSSDGWGIPMATDIAFAVGVLSLLGKRVPPPLRILLLALAVIDDVGAIIVIAIFYSSELGALGFGVLASGILLTLLLQWVGARNQMLYAVPAVMVWSGTYMAGIHPTLAGVIIGMMTPVRAWFDTKKLAEQPELFAFDPKDHRSLKRRLRALETISRESVSPVDRLIHGLHGWVSYFIMPVFALANAGVPLGNASLDGVGTRVFFGVALGLALGKPIGVFALSWLAVRFGLAHRPSGVTWTQVAFVGVVAGIGFTMAIFIANLAYPPCDILETSKLAILSASAFAAVLSFVIGRTLLKLPVEAAADGPSPAG